MRYAAAILVALLPVTVSTHAHSEKGGPAGLGFVDPGSTDAIVQIQPNTTGNDIDAVIAPGATGAETFNSNSAAAGNASHPERAVPNGSAGGGSSGQGVG